MSSIDVAPQDLETIETILRTHIPECEVRAFGSRLRWTARESSDLDLAIMTDKPLGAARMAELREAFTETNLPFKVDLVDWAAAKQNFRHIIEQRYEIIQPGRSRQTETAAEKNWKIKTIDEIKARIDGAVAIGPFGSRMKSELYVTSGIPVIRGNNISDTKVLRGEFVYVSEHTADELRSSNAFPSDLVFPHRGSIGKVGIVPEKGPRRYVLSTSLMKLTCDKSSVDPTFLFYFFRSPTGRHELLKNASTVGTPGIATPLSSLKSIRVPLPPLQEQKAIAHILGALDDKIELNRQMNEALEAMARALFKSWFVNFDPVRAKAEGGDPGLPKPIADLFPEGLDDEGLPIGWRRVPFLEKAELLSGGTPSTDEPAYWVGSILWASAKDISQARDAFLIATERTITERGVDESATQIIPKLATVVVARGATTGRFCMLGRDMAMNQTCYALRSRIAHPLWINLAFASLVDELVHSAHGSVFDTITTKTFDSAQTIDPGGKILDRFETYVGPLFERILLNIEQSQTLAAIRDTLLPKLISGEIRVKDAERVAARYV